MEYFVRTSHIVAGITYLLIVMGYIGSLTAMFLIPDYKTEDARNVFLGVNVLSIVFLIA